MADITPLANLTDLAWLMIRDNEITDIPPLANLTHLETCDSTTTRSPTSRRFQA